MVAKRFRDGRHRACWSDHKAKEVRVENGEKVAGRRARGRARSASRATRSSAPSGASPTPRASASRSSASRSRSRRPWRSNEFLQTTYPEHLRVRRCDRPVPVHAHGVAHGVVLRGERALRPLQEVQGRLLRHPLGDVHRARGRARGPERDRGEGEGHRRTTSSPTASTTSTARSPTARRTALVKVLTKPRHRRDPRLHDRRRHAGEIIVEFVAAMKHGIGLNKILGTIHIYPTYVEVEQVRRGHLEALDGDARADGGGWRRSTTGRAARAAWAR